MLKTTLILATKVYPTYFQPCAWSCSAIRLVNYSFGKHVFWQGPHPLDFGLFRTWINSLTQNSKSGILENFSINFFTSNTSSSFIILSTFRIPSFFQGKMCFLSPWFFLNQSRSFSYIVPGLSFSNSFRF